MFVVKIAKFRVFAFSTLVLTYNWLINFAQSLFRGMTMLEKIFMTNHAIDRIFERFPRLVEEKKLHRNAINMHFQHKSRIWTDLFVPMLESSTENRSYLNNTRIMMGFYERYGYDSIFRFFDNVEMRARFVMRQSSDDSWVIVTVIEMEYERIRQNVKYNKPKNTLGSKQEVQEDDTSRVYLSPKVIEQNREMSRQQLQESTEKAVAQARCQLLWQNEGKVRDRFGYIVTDLEQIANSQIDLGMNIPSIHRLLREKVKAEDFSKGKVDSEGFYHFSRRLSGFIFDFKMLYSKNKGAMQVNKIYKAA